MSRKKMLVAEGYFDGAGQPYGEEQKRIYIGEVERVVVEEDVVEEDVVEEDDEFFYCQFCDRSFTTERGVLIHEKRWCPAGKLAAKRKPTPIEVRI